MGGLIYLLSRETVKKMLRHSEPPGYRRRQPPKRPKLAPFTDIIDRILEEDRTVHRKQHHTAKRIFERLRDEHGFTGKETIVKDYVRERRLRRREMFVPLSHPPGHANVLRGHRESIGERFVRDREALKRPLPAPFDACDKQGTRVNSLSLVRYRTNDYSVPVAYGHQEVWIRGYVHEVVIGCGAGIIARHPRSYDREDMVFDPIHYLPLLEHKIGALDQAAPLAGWELPEGMSRPLLKM